MSIKIKYRYEGNFEKPKKQTSGAAGIDLVNNDAHSCTVEVGDSAIISTGVFIEIPEGYVGLLFARSSLGFKYSCTLANSVGVIDSDYRGEIKAKIVNHGKEAHTFTPGERFAQLVIVPVPQIELVESELSETERGEGGFGSTGK